ncbi:MAG: cupin domain-containing protein, partial [Chloroflexota bacterium]
MKGKIELYNSEELQWVNDLAFFRSFMGRVPWMSRFGSGKIKALSFDEESGAGAYLLDQPEGYDPFQAHAHGGNEYSFILEGELHHDGRVLTPGCYLYFPKEVEHGPFVPGKGGCVLYTVIDGAFFSK